MFDIGAVELLIVGIVALVVVGPQDLPRLIKTVSGFIRKLRSMASEFRMGVEGLADEVQREVDPFINEFKDLRDEEGLTPDMTPEEVTDHIMANRSKESEEAKPQDETDAVNGDAKIDNGPKNKDDAHDV